MPGTESSASRALTPSVVPYWGGATITPTSAGLLGGAEPGCEPGSPVPARPSRRDRSVP